MAYQHVQHATHKANHNSPAHTSTSSDPPTQPTPPASPAPYPLSTLFVLDTNVILHQMDLLCSKHDLFEHLNLIILRTVDNEVSSNSKQLHDRLRALLTTHPHAYTFENEHHAAASIVDVAGETPNDRNDRAIRKATEWYMNHAVDSRGTKPTVVLLTNDRDNQRKARTAGLHCLSIYDFVQAHATTHPALGPMLAAVMREDRERQQRQSWEYQPWLGTAEVQAGLLSGRLFKGTFKVNRDWHSEASVRVRGINQSLLIDGARAMNRAIDGDVVVVEVLPESEWKRAKGSMEPRMDEQDMVNIQAANNTDSAADTAVEILPPTSTTSTPLLRTARVVAIAQRNWRSYAGSLSLSSKHRGSFMFLPVNRRIPRIRIQSQQAEQLMSKRLLVAIDSWPVDSHNPLGHYVSTIGDIGDRETETAVLLLEHDIPTAPWTNAVLDCLPSDTHNIDPRHTAGRVDYRGVVEVFSIDPPGCTDIDDALHVRQLPNGNYEVAVHIADVAHYVKPDTALDTEAAHRGTSVYLVDRRIDMLPSLLSTNLCSLKSGIDRLTFSCVWEMNDRADILHTEYHRAVIRSVASFTYQQAQDRISSDSPKPDSITKACKSLNHLAKQLRAKRIAAGALMLASAEVRFLLDNETRQPTDVGMYVQKEANALVEEFMLLANISVAQRINTYYPSFSLLRRHPTPPTENFAPLVQAAAAVGFTIQADTSKQLADSLDRCVIPVFPMFNKLIRIMATRCMTQAIYFCSGDVERGSVDFHHYGLAASIYTHFTSPIRRYADIVVHRLLAASLDYAPLPDSVQSRERMVEMAENINHRHRMAQLVGRASSELYTLIYFGDGADGKRVAESGGIEVVGRVVEEEAIIVSVRATGLRVFVPRYGLEAAITLVKKKRTAEEEEEAEAGDESESAGRLAGSEYVFDAERLTVSGPRGTFRIFEQVRVSICVKEKQRRRWLSVLLVEKDGVGVVSQAVEAVEEFRKGGGMGSCESSMGGGKGLDGMDEEKEGGDVMVVEDEVEADGEVVQDPNSVKRRRVIRST